MIGSKQVESKQEGNKQERVVKVHYFDYSLLAIVIFLMCFGLIMLYSASSYSAQIENGNSMHYFIRQSVFGILGFCAMFVVGKLDYHLWAKHAKKMYFIAWILMALVLTPLGKEVNGARRWIKLPLGQTFQPSEFTKIAVIVFISLLLCQTGKQLKNRQVVMIILCIGGLAAGGVLFLTDNLSTAIIVLGIVCTLVFVAHRKTAKFMALAAVLAGLIAIGVRIMDAFMVTSQNFRLRRILVWLHPEEYLQEGGYQVMQGLYAIGSGGFFGKGLGNSAQKIMIPEAQNDMILAIVCEELGVFGALVLLTMFALLLHRLMYIAKNAPDTYGTLIVSGVFAHIALQVLFNVSVVLNVIPTTGITLPFVSYGGTSTLFLMIEMGMALSVSNRIEFDEVKEA